MFAVFTGPGFFFDRAFECCFFEAQCEFGGLRGCTNGDEARRQRNEGCDESAANSGVSPRDELHIYLRTAGDSQHSAWNNGGGHCHRTGWKSVYWAIKAAEREDNVCEIHDGEDVAGWQRSGCGVA